MTSPEERALEDERKLVFESFDKHDLDDSGKLSRAELISALQEVMEAEDLAPEDIETVVEEFDKDGDGELDFCEFKTMVKYLTRDSKQRSSIVMDDIMLQLGSVEEGLDEEGDDGDDDDDGNFDYDDEAKVEEMILKAQLRRNGGKSRRTSTSSVGSNSNSNSIPKPGQSRVSNALSAAIRRSKRDNEDMLAAITSKIYPVADILCVQGNQRNSRAVDLDPFLKEDSVVEGMDRDFAAAFPPSQMRCLALVSHNEMKSTMRKFVVANKNLLKKFRLTGTNSTMTMLREVFSDEPAGTVMFGPACASGPLGGDAELVSLMVGGRIGGILFFRDPMSAHPHRADIDCLVRQALVHNTMMAETPTSALMMCHCLRAALKGEGKPEMIPSFFFSLQCPSVEAYKAEQKRVVEMQKKMARESMTTRSSVTSSALAGAKDYRFSCLSG
ncbi:unnamed protein product [Pseudo-nitzschia multistriata]|uniref:EF-hand domain-containing protein n=1 Tax=Pseudo-nitzschia multistriata TaxID=183589 RepID=A0A448Z7T0_9STRA|nr:unnamed protein product [Pseudo-nitzschia multistriata]